MIRHAIRVAVAMLSLALAACGGGGVVKRINPPVASVQQLRVAPDGTWSLVVRVNNFSTVPMTFERIDAVLSIDGGREVALQVPLGFDIPGQSAEVVERSVQAPAKLDPARPFAYHVTGTITTSEPEKVFDFEKDSRMEPVPGIPGEFR